LAEVVPLEATTGGSDGSTQPPRDFVAKPELRLLELGSGRETVVGPGFAPLWAPGSRGLVFLRPQGDRRCSGEVCKGDLAVVYVELATARRRVLLEGGRWGLLSWLGSRVLVSDVGNLTGTLAVSTDGSKRRIAPSPQEVWGGSPDGRWLVTVRSGRPEFLSVEGGVPTGASVPISTGRGVLAEGAWSPDSTRVAAVVLGRRAGRLVTFGPEAPIPRTFAGARGTTGPVLWSPDGGQVVATRTARRGLQVIACRVEDLRCRPLLDYERDVSLVGLTGG
jgi:hypothetical protein